MFVIKSGADTGGVGETFVLKRILKTLYERDRDDLAVALIERFGGVANIFAASYESLLTVKGVTPRVASFFSSVLPVHRQALMRTAADKPIDNERALITYASVYFINVSTAAVACLCLDKRNRIEFVERLGNQSLLRDTVGCICRHNADRIALISRNPDVGVKRAIPSADRIKLLSELTGILRVFETELLDYAELSERGFFTLRGVSAENSSIIRSLTDASEDPFDMKIGLSEKLDLIADIGQKS